MLQSEQSKGFNVMEVGGTLKYFAIAVLMLVITPLKSTINTIIISISSSFSIIIVVYAFYLRFYSVYF